MAKFWKDSRSSLRSSILRKMEKMYDSNSRDELVGIIVVVRNELGNRYFYLNQFFFKSYD